MTGMTEMLGDDELNFTEEEGREWQANAPQNVRRPNVHQANVPGLAYFLIFLSIVLLMIAAALPSLEQAVPQPTRPPVQEVTKSHETPPTPAKETPRIAIVPDPWELKTGPVTSSPT